MRLLIIELVLLEVFLNLYLHLSLIIPIVSTDIFAHSIITYVQIKMIGIKRVKCNKFSY